MGWPTKKDKMKNSRFYDLRAVEYKNYKTKNLRHSKFV